MLRPSRRNLPTMEQVVLVATPVAALALVQVGPRVGVHAEMLLGVAAALPLLLAFASRPDLALLLLVVVTPFQVQIFSGLYELGLPAGLVAQGGLWKEAAAFGVLVAAVAGPARRHRRLDGLDGTALALVVLGTVYALIPEIFVDEAGSALSAADRFVAWREAILPIALLVAARRIQLSEAQVTRLIRAFGAVAAVVAGLALYEFIDSDGWNRLMVDTLGVNRWRLDVLQYDARNLVPLDDIRAYGTAGDRDLVRVGGTVLTPLTLSFMLLVAAGPLLERMIQRRDTMRTLVMTGLVVLGVLLTQTRSALAGVGLALFATTLRAPGRDEVRRTRFLLLAVAALAVAAPLAISGGLADRVISGDRGSDEAHGASPTSAFERVLDEPFGHGVGLGAVGSDPSSSFRTVSENQFLDYGIQLGVLGTVLFGLLVVRLIVSLGGAAERVQRQRELLIALLGLRSSLIGLLVVLWYLTPIVFPMSWAFFPLMGAALGAADALAAHHPPAARLQRATGVRVRRA